MKKYILHLTVTVYIMVLAACAKILDKSPLDKFTDAAVFVDVNLMDRYLLDCYSYLQGCYGAYLTPDLLSDDIHDTHGVGKNYLFGTMAPDNVRPLEGVGRGSSGLLPLSWGNNFKYIQKLNVFLSKIDGVLDQYSPADKIDLKEKVDEMKGEALFLRAFCYSNFVRAFGGVPIFKKPFEFGDDYSEAKRASFEEVIQFITEDIDAATPLLKIETTQGRASRGTALALKSRILLFAASDLVADGNPTSPDPENLISYKNPDRIALWTAAKNAAKAVMDLNVYQLNDWGTDKAIISQHYYDLFNERTLSNKEIIWGKMFINGVGPQYYVNRFHGPNSFDEWGMAAPSQELVDAFQMEDGSDFFEHFTVNGAGFYTNISNKYHDSNPYKNRDPRFYGAILFDGAKWKPRPLALQSRDSVGVYDRRTRIITQGGSEISKIFGIDTKNGPIDAEDGTISGYVMKKHLDVNLNSTSSNNENVWIEFRYAEILLNYAEACMMLGETLEASKYINMIRNRAGLPGFEGDIVKALRYERRMELCFENMRWFDTRRWKIFGTNMQDPKGIDITEIFNRDNNVTTVTWRQIISETRPAATSSMYWFPLLVEEIQKAPQLQQTPGY